MSPRPNGRLHKTNGGFDLVIERTFAGTLDDVWQSVTDPKRSARWFGAWEGEGGAGKTIRVQMAFEEGKPWFDSQIEACEPPHRLALHTKDEHGEWTLELLLSSEGERTKLTFVHHLKDLKGVDSTGPGWEYYLDNLDAAYRDQPLPKFTDYYPSQKEYFAKLAEALG